MKLVTAIIKPFALDPVRAALSGLGARPRVAVPRPVGVRRVRLPATPAGPSHRYVHRVR